MWDIIVILRIYNIMLDLFIILDNSLNNNWHDFYFYIINVNNFIELYKNIGMTIFLFFFNKIVLIYNIIFYNTIQFC